MLSSGINRNILECKEKTTRSASIKRKVLIETYWNVKIINVVAPYVSALVLIETYWNVKIKRKVALL